MGLERSWRPADLVLIIFRNAPIEVRRVTICGLPVHESVTVMTGHENARKSSKDENRGPQERSYLVDYGLSERNANEWKHQKRTMGCCLAENTQCTLNRPFKILLISLQTFLEEAVPTNGVKVIFPAFWIHDRKIRHIDVEGLSTAVACISWGRSKAGI
jgi:hypothetical protein